MDHMNCFHPYSGEQEHENPLTRAFLLVFRFVPLVRVAFLDLVRDVLVAQGHLEEAVGLSTLSMCDCDVQTQKRNLELDEGKLISVLITNSPFTPQSAMDWISRDAVYDGLITLEAAHILVIENKPYGDVWEDQLKPAISSVQADHNIELYKDYVVILWKDIIDKLVTLSSCGLLHPTEALLVDDFLEYVDTHFSQLRPYASLAVCKNDSYLLRKRCESLLQQVSEQMFPNSNSGRVRAHRGFQNYLVTDCDSAPRVFLYPVTSPDDWEIMMALWPAGTVSQGRVFYKLPPTQHEAFLSLCERGWALAPNLSFSFAARGLVWSSVAASLPLGSYLQFWRNHQDLIRRHARTETRNYQDLFETFSAAGMISSEVRSQLDEEFTNKGRNTINVCAGFEASFTWKKAEALRLDKDGEFVREIGRRIREILQTLSTNA